MTNNLASFTDILGDEIADSQPFSLSSSSECDAPPAVIEDAMAKDTEVRAVRRPAKYTGQYGQFRSVEEIDPKYRDVFTYPYFNLVQSKVFDDAIYTDKSMVICAPTGAGKTVVFEMAIVQLLMELEDTKYNDDFKIIYMAPVKALCTERLTEWYPKFTKLGLLCIEVTGDTDVDFSQLKPYRIIITTPEKWDMLTRRWRDHRSLVEVIKLFLIDEVHILNDETRGPVLEAVVSRMKTIQSSAQSAHRIEQLQKQYRGTEVTRVAPPRIRFVAVSATVSNPEDVATWLGTADKSAVFYRFGDECRPVKLKRVVEGYPCAEGTSIFKFDIILNYKLWPVIQKYHDGKPTLIFCNTRKSVILTAETLSRELTINFNPEQKARLTVLASNIKTKKLQLLVLSGVGVHHAGLLYEERMNIERAFRNRDLPILITTTTLAMGVNLPAHLVIIKNTQQYVNGAYQEYSISTVLQMVGRAGRPQYDTEATAVIMTRLADKPRYQALVGGSDPLQSYLHKRLAENLNSEAALGTVGDVAQCVQWLTSTFLCVRAARDPKRYLGLTPAAPQHLISKKIEELCVKAMNGLASSGLITMDDASCIESTEAGRLMSIYYLDLETMKHIMKINGTETLDQLLGVICESHELADMHLRMDERRCLNALNRNNAAATIRFPMRGKISTRQMKLNCIIQAILGCLPIPDPSLNQEAMKIMRIADRICKCLVAYVTRPVLISQQPQYFSAILNSLILAKCVAAHLWENSPFVSKQLKGIGPTFSNLLATAGKANFMLLEESHPRDLERIMNKGPPAGNVLRKQISLLPKYQLTMTPVDEKRVTVRLVLLNQSHLAENLDHLTAGDTHKSYIIVGDSVNHLLLLTAFKDKDLISVYDGSITYEITRKHDSEHKIFAHCISSTFVGLDGRCEYLFKDLETLFLRPQATFEDITKKSTKRQTSIKDSFKERKRKNTADNDITQSKEKKKRDSALIEKFKYLKESFGIASKELKKDLSMSSEMSNKILSELTELDKSASMDSMTKCFSEIKNDSVTEQNFMKDNSTDSPIIEDIDGAEFMNDEKINSILNEIESEISKESKKPEIARVHVDSTIPTPRINCGNKNTNLQRSSELYNNKPDTKASITQQYSNRSFNHSKKRKGTHMKSNYSFIDLLEKNVVFSDNEENGAKEDSGFSNTIKSKIEKYLKNTHINTTVPEKNIEELLENSSDELPSVKVIENCDQTKSLFTTQTLDNVIRKEPIMETRYDENGKKEKIIHERIRAIHGNSERRVIKTKDVLMKATESSVNKSKVNETELNSLQKECLIQKGNKIENIQTLDTVDKELVMSMSCLEKEDSLIKSIADNDFLPKISDNTALAENYSAEKCLVSNSKMEMTLSSKYLASESCNVIPDNDTVTEDKYASTNEFNTKNDESFRIAIMPSIKYVNNEVVATESTNTVASPQHAYNGSTSTINHQENNYITKYSYSATKIDVSTKDTPEHVIHIIRKLKVDLDITEILSKEDNNIPKETENTTNSQCCKFEDKNIVNYYLCNKMETGEKLPVALNKTMYDSESRNIVDIGTNILGIEVFCNNKENSSIACNMPESIECNSIIHKTLNEKLKTDIPIAKEIKETEDSDKMTKHVIEEPVESAFVEKEMENEDVSIAKEEDSNKEVYAKNQTFKETTPRNLSEISENDKIASILQKYSNIQWQNCTSDVSQDTAAFKTRNDSKNKLRQKPKRPFNISDIDYFDASLPSSIIKETPSLNNGVITMNPIVRPKELTEIYEDNIDTNREASPVQIGEELIEENTKDQLPEIPYIDFRDEPVSDFKMDASMFDPKTLIQCLGRDETDEIIPPPPGFSDIDDTCNYSPEFEDYYNRNGSFGTSELHDDNAVIEGSGSIFLDTDDLDLTPSKEIETWTLSREDSWEYRHSRHKNPIKSCTVMRKNSPLSNNLRPSMGMLRNKKLGQFKFSHKDKMKIRM